MSVAWAAPVTGQQAAVANPAAVPTGDPKPLPMVLILRRVGRERELQMTGRELRALVRCIYLMYARAFREQDMLHLFKQLDDDYPADLATIDLLPPTA